MRTEIDQKYDNLIVELDLLIKSGKINEVTTIITDLVISQVPRSARRGLAKCCRRIGLIGSGLRLLHPIIRSQKILEEPVNAGELCEYSALLSRNGSVAEALELLQNVDPLTAPEALLYRGQCHILNWEYSEAVEYFERFLSSTADDYSKLIARVNLISGYIVLFRLEEAEQILAETIELVQKVGASRLLANCYELWGQVYFWQNDYVNARQMLKRASDIFNNAQSLDQLLIRKTESIMEAIEGNTVDPLIQFRKLAIERKNWESVREADLFMLKVELNRNKLNHLVFGTPKAPYRHRIENLVGVKSDSAYVLGSSSGPQIDLQTGFVSGANHLPIGKKIHQVLSTLTKDFYAPVNMGTFFYELYPDEYFDVDSSPFRIRQAILRTRHWLANNNIPAIIKQNKGTYSLSITGAFGIRLQLSQPMVSPIMVRWQQLKEVLKLGASYNAEEICQMMGWSRTTFRRLAEWACDNEHLQRSGIGKATLYQLASNSELKTIKKAS